MTEANFYKSFYFDIYRFDKNHLTDYMDTGCPRHYFGCLIKGEAKITTKDTCLKLKNGEIFYIPKDLKYQSEWFLANDDEIKFYSFGFKTSPLSKSYILQKINCSEKHLKLFHELCEEVPRTNKGIGKLYSFFCEIADNMVEAKLPNSNPIVEKAIEYLNQNPNLKISEIAKLCSISESNIYPLFKKTLNKTPNEIKLNFICDEAKILLTTTDKSVQEISESLGFSSTSYFRKVLKQYVGKTPSEIRKNAII